MISVSRSRNVGNTNADQLLCYVESAYAEQGKNSNRRPHTLFPLQLALVAPSQPPLSPTVLQSAGVQYVECSLFPFVSSLSLSLSLSSFFTVVLLCTQLHTISLHGTLISSCMRYICFHFLTCNTNSYHLCTDSNPIQTLDPCSSSKESAITQPTHVMPSRLRSPCF